MFGINVIVVVETFIAFIFAVVIHEAAHAAAAALLGDTTLAARRRLSLNPRRQLSAIGVIVAIAQAFNLYAGLGWGKTIELDARRLRVGPNFGTILVALAGPVVNALLGIGVALGLTIIPGFNALGNATILCGGSSPLPQGGILLQNCLSNLTTQSAVELRLEQFALIFAVTNILLAILNLVPLHPLDGYHILFALLPNSQAISYRNAAPYMELILLVLLFVVPYLAQLIRLPFLDPAQWLLTAAQSVAASLTGNSILFYPVL
jgi:Zn-dependent protease